MGILHPVDLCRYISQVPEFPLNLEINTNLKAVSPTNVSGHRDRFCHPAVLLQGGKCCSRPSPWGGWQGKAAVSSTNLHTKDWDNGTAIVTERVTFPTLGLPWWRIMPDPISGVHQIKEKTRKSAGNFLEGRAGVWLGCS